MNKTPRRERPRNHDQELPPRTGESIESTVPPERGQGEREQTYALPEDETDELDPGYEHGRTRIASWTREAAQAA